VPTLAEADREHISEGVEMTNGLIAGKSRAAEVLGVPPSRRPSADNRWQRKRLARKNKLDLRCSDIANNELLEENER
jgi:hypothetical protein